MLCWLPGDSGHPVSDLGAGQRRERVLARDVRGTDKMALGDAGVFLERVLSPAEAPEQLSGPCHVGLGILAKAH